MMDFVAHNKEAFMALAGWAFFLISEALAGSKNTKANSVGQLVKQGANYLLGKKN